MPGSSGERCPIPRIRTSGWHRSCIVILGNTWGMSGGTTAVNGGQQRTVESAGGGEDSKEAEHTFERSHGRGRRFETCHAHTHRNRRSERCGCFLRPLLHCRTSRRLSISGSKRAARCSANVSRSSIAAVPRVSISGRLPVQRTHGAHAQGRSLSCPISSSTTRGEGGPYWAMNAPFGVWKDYVPAFCGVVRSEATVPAEAVRCLRWNKRMCPRRIERPHHPRTLTSTPAISRDLRLFCTGFKPAAVPPDGPLAWANSERPRRWALVVPSSNSIIQPLSPQDTQYGVSSDSHPAGAPRTP